MTEATTNRIEVFADPGSHISDDVAQVVYEQASRLPKERRNAEAVFALVESEPDNPLRPHYPWDDAHAARLYRLEVTRLLLRSVSVRIVEEDAVYERPAFYAVRVEEEAARPMVYARYSEVIGDRDLVERVIAGVRRDLAAFKARYDKHRAILQEASPEIVAILNLADEVLGGDR